MKILILSWANNGILRQNIRKSLVSYHLGRGDSVDLSYWRDPHQEQKIRDCHLAYLFNGQHPVMKRSLDCLRSTKTPAIFFEVAWFPQSQYWYFDPAGTAGASSLHHDDLSWLTPEDFRNLEEFRQRYRAGRSLTDQGYILVFLQVPGDTAHQWSPFRSTAEFIHYTRRIYPNREIIFRPHPKSQEKLSSLKIHTDHTGDLFDLICGASFVFGINSTALLESALLGKKTIACGKSFLEIGPDQEHALAALVARQVPATSDQLHPWTRPGRGLDLIEKIRSRCDA